MPRWMATLWADWARPIVLASLKVKFVAALILLVSLVIASSTWWTLSVHRRHMLQATEDKVRALAEMVDRGIQVAMQEGRSHQIGRILEQVGRDPDIEQIAIFDPRGKILRASKPGLVGQVLDRGRLSKFLEQPDLSVASLYEQGRLVQSVVKKLRNRPECEVCHGSAEPVIGYLYLDMSFGQTQHQIAEMERTAWWTMLITAAVLAVGGGMLLIRFVDRPVARLIRAMTEVERGNLAVRARGGAPDELGRLSESFNSMVEKLAAARAEIENYHGQRLARAERLATLGELAASLAHEIKNPLAGIGGAIQVMGEELPDDHPRKAIMREVLAQVHRLDRTVRDLLALARPGRPEVAPCDIHQILDRTLILLAENPEAKEVRVVRAYQPGIPLLDADSKQLGQVFLNLVLNAVQAMPEGGQITIRTALRDANGGDGEGQAGTGRIVEVAVSDTGPGIPPETLEDIFTPFVSTKRRGTGLGLSVSRRIVEEHGGWITAESPAGEGATFRVCLPLVAVGHHERGDG
jgi:two-component system NtrC family sensor kinase